MAGRSFLGLGARGWASLSTQFFVSKFRLGWGLLRCKPTICGHSLDEPSDAVNGPLRRTRHAAVQSYALEDGMGGFLQFAAVAKSASQIPENGRSVRALWSCEFPTIYIALDFPARAPNATAVNRPLPDR